MKNLNQNVMTILTLVLLAGVSRLLPHPWNFTALGAMALFSGSRMPNKWLAFLAPFLTLLWTDAVIGFHITMLYVYASVALITVIGFWTHDSSQVAFKKVAAGSILGSCLFFLITNFGVWLTQGLYAKTWAGFVECFAMAIPFFHYQVLGDLFYSGVLFGLYALIRSGQTADEKSISA